MAGFRAGSPAIRPLPLLHDCRQGGIPPDITPLTTAQLALLRRAHGRARCRPVCAPAALVRLRMTVWYGGCCPCCTTLALHSAVEGGGPPPPVLIMASRLLGCRRCKPAAWAGAAVAQGMLRQAPLPMRARSVCMDVQLCVYVCVCLCVRACECVRGRCPPQKL